MVVNPDDIEADLTTEEAEEGSKLYLEEWGKKIKELMEKNGYNVIENVSLQEDIHWRPQIYATKEEEKIAIDVRVITELDDDYLSELLKAQELVQELKVFLAFPDEIELESLTVEEISKSRLGLILIHDELLEILIDPFAKLSPPKHFTPGHISNELLDQMQSLENVKYSKELKKFILTYKETKFNSLDEEYTMVLNFIKSLLIDIYGKTVIAKDLTSFKEIEPILMGDKNYRDHFLHSFQVFILGTLIIDKNHTMFNNWYKHSFPKTNEISIDFPWLLASIFHDFGYPLQNFNKIFNHFFEKFLSTKPAPSHTDFFKVVKDEFYIDALLNLTDLDKHLKQENITEDWSIISENVEKDGFYKILLKHYKNGNHGVLSSLSILKKISLEKAFSEEYAIGPYSKLVYPAALAMALHDWPVWSNLEERDDLPISIEKYPLCALLIFCDNIQEWGRPGGVYKEDKAPQLTTITFEEKSVCIELTWNDISKAIAQKVYFDKILEALKSNEYQFKIIVNTNYVCSN